MRGPNLASQHFIGAPGVTGHLNHGVDIDFIAPAGCHKIPSERLERQRRTRAPQLAGRSMPPGQLMYDSLTMRLVVLRLLPYALVLMAGCSSASPHDPNTPQPPVTATVPVATPSPTATATADPADPAGPGDGTLDKWPGLPPLDPQPLPTGASWSGVYYSPLFGYLHLVQEGPEAHGRWLTPRRNWGELEGDCSDDVLRFRWSEHTAGAVGEPRRGVGYLQYSRPEGNNVDDMVSGKLLVNGDDGDGREWTAIKQRNVAPNPGAIGNESNIGGGDWDSP